MKKFICLDCGALSMRNVHEVIDDVCPDCGKASLLLVELLAGKSIDIKMHLLQNVLGHELNNERQQCLRCGTYIYIQDQGLLPCTVVHFTGCHIVGSNPLHQHEDGTWWWYDECWCHEQGPYVKQEDAVKDLKDYMHELVYGPDGYVEDGSLGFNPDDDCPF